MYTTLREKNKDINFLRDAHSNSSGINCFDNFLLIVKKKKSEPKRKSLKIFTLTIFKNFNTEKLKLIFPL